MPDIHQTAIIEEGAKLADDVTVGPYCVVGSKVQLASGVVLKSHIVVDGNTSIGENTTIYPFASIGTAPQDLKYKGEDSSLVIGTGNVIREHVTINPGTEGGGMVTEIGDNCLLMIGVHIAHDCKIGNSVILANNATLGGHVEIGNHAIIGGLSAVHQFVRIGKYAIVGGMSGVENDVIPYGSVMGDRAGLAGLNLIGLKRHQFNRKDIHALRSAYRMLFSPEGTLSERIEDVIEHFNDNQPVMDIVNFVRSDSSSRSVCMPKNGSKAA